MQIQDPELLRANELTEGGNMAGPACMKTLMPNTWPTLPLKESEEEQLADVTDVLPTGQV